MGRRKRWGADRGRQGREREHSVGDRKASCGPARFSPEAEGSGWEVFHIQSAHSASGEGSRLKYRSVSC